MMSEEERESDKLHYDEQLGYILQFIGIFINFSVGGDKDASRSLLQ